MPHRAVLDSNIVLSALLFSEGRLSWIRHAWKRQQIVPLVCPETTRELLRVLNYPKFQLDAAEQQALLADFLPYTEIVHLPDTWPDLPTCRDDSDQVFLVLAHAGHAAALVSGDADILALRGTHPEKIITAQELKDLLASTMQARQLM